MIKAKDEYCPKCSKFHPIGSEDCSPNKCTGFYETMHTYYKKFLNYKYCPNCGIEL